MRPIAPALLVAALTLGPPIALATAEPTTTTVVAPTATMAPTATAQPTVIQAPLPTAIQVPTQTQVQAPLPTAAVPTVVEPTYTQTQTQTPVQQTQVPTQVPTKTQVPTATQEPVSTPSRTFDPTPGYTGPTGTPAAPAPSSSVTKIEAPLPTPSALPSSTPGVSSSSVPTASSAASATPSGTLSTTPTAPVPAVLTSSPTPQSSVVATSVSGSTTVITTLSATPQAQVPVVSPAPTTYAPAAAVEAAKNAPPVYVDPVIPPPPPQSAVNVNFNTVINNTVIVNNTVNNTVINNWTYLDYDDWNRPVVYNPYPDPFGFRYFYEGDYRTVWVQPGARIIINLAVVGVFPFTAISVNSVISVGYFNGGCWNPPPTCLACGPPLGWVAPAPIVYSNVNANVIAANRTVAVGKVTVVGRDEARPPGQQDVFMLDDNTLAWGQVTDGRNGGAINIAATQATPGVGPTDDGVRLVNAAKDLSANKESSSSTWPWVAGVIGVLVLLAGVAYWVTKRRPSGGAHVS